MSNEQQAQEPVAWRYQNSRGHYRYRGYVKGFDVDYKILRPIPLYTAPPLRDLSKDEICELYFNNPTDDIFVFAKDVLAKAREKL